jgi:hypothetical protein
LRDWAEIRWWVCAPPRHRDPKASLNNFPGFNVMGALPGWKSRNALYGAIDEATGIVVVGPGQGTPPAELPKEPNVSEGWFRYVGSDNVPRNGAFNRVITPHGAYRVYFVQAESVFGLTFAGLQDELNDEIFPVFFPMIVIGLLVTWNTVRTALRPLQRASDEAAAISMDRPDSRLPTDRLPAEIIAFSHRDKQGDRPSPGRSRSATALQCQRRPSIENAARNPANEDR